MSDEDKKTAILNDDSDASRDEDTTPLHAGDDFSDGVDNQDDLNPEDAPLDAGINALNEDPDDETIVTDEPSDNPLDTEAAIDEVDNKILPEEQQNLGDVVYNPLEEDQEEDEE
ncbi:MAG: hypothetical protein ACMG57_03965 [Candidatus Dojkabacteria bacterium]